MSVDGVISHIPLSCTQIISGGAEGIDALAKEAAEKLGIGYICYLPDYDRYGRSAPLKRNDQIIAAADLVLAFWDFRSRGTSYVIAECIKRGKPIKVFDLVMRE